MDMRVSEDLTTAEDKSMEITPFEESRKTKQNYRVSVTCRTMFSRINIH